MTTPDQIEAQTDEAMTRLTQQINRSAGQHLRALRRVRAGQPVLSEGTESAQHILRIVQPVGLERINTERLQDIRAIQKFGEASQAAKCPPGFCGFDPQCSDRACPGHPLNSIASACEPDAEESEKADLLQVPGWALIALVAVSVTVMAFFVGMHI